MELSELIDKLKELYQITEIKDLKDRLLETVLNRDTEKYDKYIEIVNGDLNTDYMQKIFQYWYADREEKKQDFTPESLATLVAYLANQDEIYDFCSGSGALSVKSWTFYKDRNFNMYEFDENVIPFLLFNMAVRNIRGSVTHINLITNEVFKEYNVLSFKNQKYSEVIINENSNI